MASLDEPTMKAHSSASPAHACRSASPPSIEQSSSMRRARPAASVGGASSGSRSFFGSGERAASTRESSSAACCMCAGAFGPKWTHASCSSRGSCTSTSDGACAMKSSDARRKAEICRSSA
eukprot:30633-Prymnesium_polylepis.1